MSLRFLDSFDHYTLNDLQGLGNGQKWVWTGGLGNGASGFPQIVSLVPGRFGNALRIGATNNNSNWRIPTKVFDNQATWIIGFAFRFGILPTSSQIICEFLDSGTAQVELRLNTSGTLQITRNGNTLTSGLSTNTLSINTWYYVEWMMTIAASISANTCQVNVNGTQWINVATGQNTKNSANATVNMICLMDQSITSPGINSYDFDDLYICDGQGSVNNTFLGDSRVECRFPASNGSNTSWTVNGTTIGYAAVNDPTPNGDSNFISSSTLNQISTFNIPALSASPSSIAGVQIGYSGRKSDAGTRTVADVVKSSSTTNVGTSNNLPGSYVYNLHVLENDPATSAAWLTAAVNAVEIGVKEMN
jgi:hypothetical protein